MRFISYAFILLGMHYLFYLVSLGIYIVVLGCYDSFLYLTDWDKLL